MKLRIAIIQRLIDINEKLFFYPKLKSFYKKKLSGTTPFIIDVGSNKGQSIDFFLSINKNSTIIGFEPNVKLYDFLVEKYRNNANVSLYNTGISDHKGYLDFNINLLDETSTFEELNYSSLYLKKKSQILGVVPKEIIVDQYKVKVIDLKSFIEENEIDHIDVLKIDVEGHEYQCLFGLFKDSLNSFNVNYIQIENHFDDMYKKNRSINEINTLLAEHNYIKSKEIKHGFGDFYEMIFQRETC